MPDDRRVLEGVDRLVVDGTNVLHALRRSTTPLPAAALIGRLRAIVPPGVSVILVLDGSPEHGMASRHVASGVEIRYAGRFTADEVIARLVEYEFAASSPGTLVVTDDIELTSIVRRSGGRTTRNGWLLDRLDRQRLSAPSIGRPRAQRPNKPNEPPRGSSEQQPNQRQPGVPSGPRGPRGSPHNIGRPNPPGRAAGLGAGSGPTPDDTAADDRPRWSPGRGATRKRGNGRRKPASGR